MKKIPLTIRPPEDQHKQMKKLSELKSNFIPTSISDLYIIAADYYLKSNKS